MEEWAQPAREKAFLSKTRSEDQSLEIRIVTQHRQVLVVLRTHTKIGLKIKGAPQGFERRINRAQARTSGRQSIMYVCRFGLALERAFEHFLRGHIFAAIQFDHAPVIERISITRER